MVLEGCRSPEALAVLQTWAKRLPDTWLAEEAAQTAAGLQWTLADPARQLSGPFSTTVAFQGNRFILCETLPEVWALTHAMEPFFRGTRTSIFNSFGLLARLVGEHWPLAMGLGKCSSYRAVVPST